MLCYIVAQYLCYIATLCDFGLDQSIKLCFFVYLELILEGGIVFCFMSNSRWSSVVFTLSHLLLVVRMKSDEKQDEGHGMIPSASISTDEQHHQQNPQLVSVIVLRDLRSSPVFIVLQRRTFFVPCKSPLAMSFRAMSARRRTKEKQICLENWNDKVDAGSLWWSTGKSVRLLLFTI